jgi:hypothetical protein
MSAAVDTPPAPWLSGWKLSAWAVVAAFGAYFCMYGFRKPFTAGSYDWPNIWGMAPKDLFVVTQVFGYMLSKFIGIRVIAGMAPAWRVTVMLALIAFAHLSLALFAVAPPSWKPVCLFLNGLPLGMVFGLVLGFLEGRRATEALSAGLCVSFIVAGGVTKTVGTLLTDRFGVPEPWMPFAAGCVFAGPLLLFGWMLSRIPAPDAADVSHRGARPRMTRADRTRLFVRYWPGLVMIVVVFLLLTVLRSLRDDFAPEMWQSLGYEDPKWVYTITEILVGIGITVICGAGVLIGDNRAAFFTSLLTSAGGFVLLAVGLLGQVGGWLNGFWFVVVTGLGLYLPYVAVHVSIFERLIAMTRSVGNLGFLMYLADSFGYLGYVGLLVGEKVAGLTMDKLELFTTGAMVAAPVSLLLLIAAAVYFRRTTT